MDLLECISVVLSPDHIIRRVWGGSWWVFDLTPDARIHAEWPEFCPW